LTSYNPNEPSDSRAEVREAAIRGGKALVFGKILNQAQFQRLADRSPQRPRINIEFILKKKPSDK